MRIMFHEPVDMLFFGALTGNMHHVKQALREGNLDVNNVADRGADGVTPLTAAVMSGHLDVVKHLVKHAQPRALVDKPTGKGSTALVLACRHGYLEIAKFLVNEGGADVNLNVDSSALCVAALGGHLQIVQWLIEECKADRSLITRQNCTNVLDCSVIGHHLDVVRYLVEGVGMNPKTDVGRSAAPLCVYAVYLHDRKSQSNRDEMKRSRAVLKYLLEECKFDPFAVVPITGDTLLHVAAFANNAYVVKYLTEKWPRLVGIPSKLNEAPVHIAAREGASRITERLVDIMRRELPEDVFLGIMIPAAGNAISAKHDAIAMFLLRQIYAVCTYELPCEDAIDCYLIFCQRVSQPDAVRYLFSQCLNHLSSQQRLVRASEYQARAMVNGRTEIAQYLTQYMADTIKAEFTSTGRDLNAESLAARFEELDRVVFAKFRSEEQKQQQPQPQPQPPQLGFEDVMQVPQQNLPALLPVLNQMIDAENKIHNTSTTSAELRDDTKALEILRDVVHQRIQRPGQQIALSDEQKRMLVASTRRHVERVERMFGTSSSSAAVASMDPMNVVNGMQQSLSDSLARVAAAQQRQRQRPRHDPNDVVDAKPEDIYELD